MGVGVYEPEEVQIENPVVNSAADLAFSYNVMLESLFASPGLRVRITGPEAHIQVVRCWIHRNCDVDVASIANGPKYSVRIPRSSDVCQIVLDGRQSSRRINVVNGNCGGNAGFGK